MNSNESRYLNSPVIRSQPVIALKTAEPAIRSLGPWRRLALEILADYEDEEQDTEADEEEEE